MADCFDYRKTYLNGSFRGVSFETDVANSEHGKKHVVHEFPKRSTPYTEDLHRRARRFRIDGFFVSDDHVDRKHNMVRAVEEPGAGILVHPTFGKVSVICASITFTDERLKGRRTSFSADFVEAGEWLFPGIFSDNRGSLISAVSSAITAVIGSYDANYIANARSLVSSSLSKLILDFGNRLQDGIEINGSVELPAYVEALNLSQQAVSSPLIYALQGANVSEAVYNYSQSVSDPRQFLGAITEFSDFPIVPFAVLGSGVISAVERQSGEAFIRAVKAVTAIEAARATIDLDLKTRVDAEERLTTAVSMLDGAIYLAAQQFDDDSRSALEDVKTQVIKDIYLQIGQLPALIINDFRRRLPSLVIADALWGDANRRDEIREGNPVMHPLWEPNCIESAQV